MSRWSEKLDIEISALKAEPPQSTTAIEAACLVVSKIGSLTKLESISAVSNLLTCLPDSVLNSNTLIELCKLNPLRHENHTPYKDRKSPCMYTANSCKGEKNGRRHHRTPNFLEADLAIVEIWTCKSNWIQKWLTPPKTSFFLIQGSQHYVNVGLGIFWDCKKKNSDMKKQVPLPALWKLSNISIFWYWFGDVLVIVFNTNIGTVYIGL